METSILGVDLTAASGDCGCQDAGGWEGMKENRHKLRQEIRTGYKEKFYH